MSIQAVREQVKVVIRHIAFISLFSILLVVFVVSLAIGAWLIEYFGFPLPSQPNIGLSQEGVLSGALWILGGVALSMLVEGLSNWSQKMQSVMEKCCRKGWEISSIEEKDSLSIPERAAYDDLIASYEQLMMSHITALPSYIILPAGMLMFYFESIQTNRLGILYIGFGTFLSTVGPATAGTQTCLTHRSKVDQRVREVASSQIGVVLILIGVSLQFVATLGMTLSDVFPSLFWIALSGTALGGAWKTASYAVERE
jgi:putative copper export protein